MSSILSALIGGAAGLFKFLLGKHLENKHQQQMALMAAAGLVVKDRDRAGGIKDKGVSFTRRVLAFMLATTLCLPVWYAVVYPDTTISIPQDFYERGFWDWVLGNKGTLTQKYVEVKAPVLAMPIYDLCAMIIGFYFGSGGSRSR